MPTSALVDPHEVIFPSSRPFDALESARLVEQYDRDQRVAEEAAAQAAPSMLSRMGDAFTLTNIVPNVASNIKEDLYTPTADPNWALPDAETIMKDLEDSGVPQVFAGKLTDAVSQEHYDAMKARLIRETDMLQELGPNASAYLIGAGLLDPVGILIGIATGGWGYMSKAGKIANGLRMGAAAAGVNAALSGAAAYGDPGQDTGEAMLTGAAVGAVLGGLGGAWGARSLDEIRTHDAVVARLQNEHANLTAELREGRPLSPATEMENATQGLRDRISRVESDLKALDALPDTQLGPKVERLVAERDDLVSRIRAISGAQKEADLATAFPEHKPLGNVVRQAAETRAVSGQAGPKGDNAMIEALRKAGLVKDAPAPKEAPKARPGDSTEVLSKRLADVEAELRNLAEIAKKHEVRVNSKRLEVNYLTQRLQEQEIAARNSRLPDPAKPEDFVVTNPDPVGGDSAGAARVGWADVEKAMDTPDEIENTPYAFGGPMRWLDAAGYLGSRKNPWFRFMGGLGEDGVGLKKGGQGAAHSAEEHAELLRVTTQVAWRREVDKAFEQFDKGGSMVGRDQRRASFMGQVADAYEAGVPVLDPNILKATNATRAFFQTYAKALKDSGVRYAKNIDIREDYLPHLQDLASIDRLHETYGSTQVNDMLYEGMRRSAHKSGYYDEYATELLDRALKQMDTHPTDLTGMARKAQADAHTNLDKLYRRIADGYLASIRDYGKWRDTITFHGLDFSDVGAFQRVMGDLGLAQDEIEKFISMFGITGEGKPARFKSRTNFDMNTEVMMRSKETGQLEPVKITQLFQRNLDSLTELYGRQVSGHVGLAKSLNILSRRDFDSLIERATAWHAENGKALGIPDREFERSRAFAEYLHKAVVGAPLEQNPGGWESTWARRGRDLNTLRLMGQVGFAQIAEFGRILGTVGVGAMWRQMPAFRQIASMAADGKLTNQMLREMEAMIGTGTHTLRGEVFTRLDPDEMGAALGQMDRALHKGKHWLGNISLMNQITTMQQRMAGAAMGQRLSDMALKGSLKDTHLRELRSYGMTDAMIPRVMDQLKQFTARGPKNDVHSLQLDKWTDPEAASVLRLALFRSARKIVQDNSYGGTHPFMHTLWGKVLFQFRSFMMNSLTKQFLNGLALHNAQSAAALLSSMFFGGLAYMAQTQLNWQHDDARRAELMTPTSIGLAAVNRSGYSGFIAPVVDTAVQVGSMGTVAGPFSNKRSTQGLGSGFLTGNPTLDLVTRLQKSTMGLANAAVNPSYRLSQQDFRNLISLAPYGNTVAAKPAFDLLMSESTLPRYSTRMSR